MSSKVRFEDALGDILKKQLKDFIESSDEERTFSVKMENKDGNDICLSVTSQKVEEDEEEYIGIDEVMDIEEFKHVQTLLGELLKGYEVPIASMIMLFANQLAFATTGVKDIKPGMASLSLSKAFHHFSSLHKANLVGGYEDIAQDICSILTKDFSNGMG